jgi:hypothetical protein
VKERESQRERLTGDRQCSWSALALLVRPGRRSRTAVLVGDAQSAGSKRESRAMDGVGRVRDNMLVVPHCLSEEKLWPLAYIKASSSCPTLLR